LRCSRGRRRLHGLSTGAPHTRNDIHTTGPTNAIHPNSHADRTRSAHLSVLSCWASVSRSCPEFRRDIRTLAAGRFPETDLASIACGFGLDGLTVRRIDDMDAAAIGLPAVDPVRC
jgi:hypothetical protein